MWSEYNKARLVLPPALDRWSTSDTGVAVHMENYKRLTFLVPTGSSDTESCGSATITVKAGADANAATAIAFKYRTCSSAGVYGTLTDASSTGFTTTNALGAYDWTYIIEVDAPTVAAAGTDFDYATISFTEVEDQAITSCVLAVLSEPRYPQGTLVE